MTNNQKTEWIQPWSPLLMKSQLDPAAVQALIKLSDQLLDDPNSESWGDNLAGQIQDEILIPHEILRNTLINSNVNTFDYLMDFVKKYFSKALRQYATFKNFPEFQKDEWTTIMNSCWVVSQKELEYNPVHIHTDCSISGVLYLKVPDFAPAAKPDRDDDGCIVFMGGAGPGQGSALIRNIFTWKPNVGDIFVFPSHLSHAVYPYRVKGGDPERRSISFNADYMRTSDFEKLKKAK